MYPSYSDQIRVDPLTGCQNFLAFCETCINSASAGPAGELFAAPKKTPDLAITAVQYSAILFVSMHNMSYLNDTKGYAYGDSAIRWMGILLQEETHQAVYRITGTEFAVFLNLDSEQAYHRLLERILERMDREAKLLEFPGAPGDVVLILHDEPFTCLDSLLMQMGEAMVRVKNSAGQHAMTFQATDFKIPAWSPYTWIPASQADISYAVRWITRASIYRMLEMGKNLDRVQQDALTDDISNLPNMRAAVASLEDGLKTARAKHSPFSILMIDGDNLREYNNLFNYAAGDEAIRQMSAVIKGKLRPNDFVARWRVGDEFLVLLPDTSAEDALKIGERFRLAVKNASQAWRIPFTISIGIACYPDNGEDTQSLIDIAEAANKQAKQQGKDQVVLADETNPTGSVTPPA